MIIRRVKLCSISDYSLYIVFQLAAPLLHKIVTLHNQLGTGRTLRGFIYWKCTSSVTNADFVVYETHIICKIL